jgi:hypothetical protein
MSITGKEQGDTERVEIATHTTCPHCKARRKIKIPKIKIPKVKIPKVKIPKVRKPRIKKTKKIRVPVKNTGITSLAENIQEELKSDILEKNGDKYLYTVKEVARKYNLTFPTLLYWNLRPKSQRSKLALGETSKRGRPKKIVS